jgi:hypothetical protein
MLETGESAPTPQNGMDADERTSLRAARDIGPWIHGFGRRFEPQPF